MAKLDNTYSELCLKEYEGNKILDYSLDRKRHEYSIKVISYNFSTLSQKIVECFIFPLGVEVFFSKIVIV
jgi:hypothetical protein